MHTSKLNSEFTISKIRFLFPVSFTIAECYLYMGFAADLLKKSGHKSLKTAEIGIRTPLKIGKLLPVSHKNNTRRTDHIQVACKLW